jgi:glutathione S-transferase
LHAIDKQNRARKNKMQNQDQEPSQKPTLERYREQIKTDMRELRERYGWNDADVAEIRAAAKDDPTWWDWWLILAQAHRNGYEQTKSNNFQRLHAWQMANGLESSGVGGAI